MFSSKKRQKSILKIFIIRSLAAIFFTNLVFTIIRKGISILKPNDKPNGFSQTQSIGISNHLFQLTKNNNKNENKFLNFTFQYFFSLFIFQSKKG